jgi:chorismate mutase-like protein
LTGQRLFLKLRRMAFATIQRFTACLWLGIALSCTSHGPPPAQPVAAGSARPEGRAPQPARGVAASTDAQSPGTLAKRSKLRVGTSGDYAPFSTRDADGTLRGFDSEIAAALAQDLGFELEWVSFRWPTLQTQLQNGEFDVAMSGVTWQPTRAVTGYLTRAVARGGPCVLGDERAARVAVNRGGVLETWARAHFADRELVTVDANQTLPELLASGRAGAIVTDSFERKAFERPGWSARCEPALARKVYWLAPDHLELAAQMEGWLRANSARIHSAQQHWFGERQKLDALGNLTDMLARRMAFMPLVAGAKAKLGIPIEDLPREQLVLDSAAASARKVSLPEAETRAFFGLQIELSKAVQRRSSEPSTLDLAQQIRPALNELGDRILLAMAEARSAGQLANCELADLDLLSPWLNAAELRQLQGSLRAFGR